MKEAGMNKNTNNYDGREVRISYKTHEHIYNKHIISHYSILTESSVINFIINEKGDISILLSIYISIHAIGILSSSTININQLLISFNRSNCFSILSVSHGVSYNTALCIIRLASAISPLARFALAIYSCTP